MASTAGSCRAQDSQVRNAKGKVLRWFGTNTDISESKESGRGIAGSRSDSDAMVVVNVGGEIVLLNVQAEKTSDTAVMNSWGRR